MTRDEFDKLLANALPESPRLLDQALVLAVKSLLPVSREQGDAETEKLIREAVVELKELDKEYNVSIIFKALERVSGNAADLEEERNALRERLAKVEAMARKDERKKVVAEFQRWIRTLGLTDELTRDMARQVKRGDYKVRPD